MFEALHLKSKIGEPGEMSKPDDVRALFENHLKTNPSMAEELKLIKDALQNQVPPQQLKSLHEKFIPQGVFEGPQFASLKESVLQIFAVQQKFRRHIMDAVLKGESLLGGGVPSKHREIRLMSLPVPDETVIEFNKVSPDEQPLDVSRLIRAAVWFISPESVAVRLREDPINSSNSAWASPNAFLHRWALSVRFFLRLAISLKRSFLEATQKAFADSEANNDALKLFEMATSGFENDHHGIGLPSEEKREEYLMNRLLALQCVLSNPAVIKFIDKKQVKILSKMRKVHSALYTTLPAGSHKPFTLLNLFLAWLEAITLRSKANMRDCTELLNLKDQCPEIAAGLGKVRAQDLCSVFHSLGTKKESKTRDTQVEEKESDTDTLIQRTKKEMRKEAPLPCFVCGKCVPTFMYCAVCQMLVYCGRECQKRDWKRKPGGHKERCALLKENVTDVLLKEAQPQPQNPADGLCVSAYVHLLKDKVVETLLQGAQMGRGEEEATASELN